MRTATSSKTGTAVAALAALGLAAAAGLGYWGYQHWDQFTSDTYRQNQIIEQATDDPSVAPFEIGDEPTSR